MTMNHLLFGRPERRAAMLAAVIVAQALCAMFFIADAVADVFDQHEAGDALLEIEAIASVALLAGVLFLMRELRRMMTRMDEIETSLRAARGEMGTVIEAFFDTWALSAAERDVALLLVKGLDNESIASMRGTANGTVRAQASAIYNKAGVDGRAQLISVFLEELLADDTVPVGSSA
jgi:DNA-binding NarL/FixJ family response regulator